MKLEAREREFSLFCLRAENLLTLWRMICVGSRLSRVRRLFRGIGMIFAGAEAYDEPERACSYACGG
jgi:hypothetical protein